MKMIIYFYLLFFSTVLYGQHNSTQRYVGEYYQGGIIFHIWYDSTGVEHGLIISPLSIEPVSQERRDSKGYSIPGSNKWKLGDYEINSYNDAQFDLMNWSSVTNKRVNPGKMSSNGKENTGQIMTQRGHLFSAAQASSDFKFGGYEDWYLPSFEECKLFYENREVVNFSLSEIESNPNIMNEINNYYSIMHNNRKNWIGQNYYFVHNPLGYNRNTDNNNGDERWYWTSTEYNEEKAYAVKFSEGRYSIDFKNGRNKGGTLKYIRPIRTF